MALDDDLIKHLERNLAVNWSNTSPPSTSRAESALHYTSLVMCTAVATLTACGVLATATSYENVHPFFYVDYGVKSLLLGGIAWASYRELRKSPEQ
ncbi:hypothetical protein J4208_05885 [Candidatus Woesearchaeota archaeon]|nr:hypothetical protein [Candidatus Woesearchaeota archaeon]